MYMTLCRIILSLRSYRHDPTATRPRIYSSFIQVYGCLLASGAMPPFLWRCSPFLSNVVPPFALSWGFIVSEFRMSATAACFGCALSRVFLYIVAQVHHSMEEHPACWSFHLERGIRPARVYPGGSVRFYGHRDGPPHQLSVAAASRAPARPIGESVDGPC